MWEKKRDEKREDSKEKRPGRKEKKRVGGEWSVGEVGKILMHWFIMQGLIAIMIAK